MNIAFLASGNLGLATIEACSKIFRPQFIAADSHSASIIDYAGIQDIPLFKGNPRNGRLAEFMKQFEIDVLLSVNYLFIVEKDVIDLVKYPINFHGSLLPKYRGRTPHVWAIINNEIKTGVTAHIIDDGCDTGDIVLQKEVIINDTDTGAAMLEKYKPLYPEMIFEMITAVKNNALTKKTQDHEKATYFGKRTPDDGAINWHWQKERIRNWVRAQAHPYPGAFSYLDGIKITIDSIEYCDHGFTDTDSNGLILATVPDIIVKTTNGAIKLNTVREGKTNFTKGKILG